MAINDGGSNGILDPSRRIRATLGEEFVNNTEADALNRIISQANYGGGVKSNTTPGTAVRNEHDISEYTNKIIHTSTNSPDQSRINAASMRMSSTSREEALNKAFDKLKSIDSRNKTGVNKVLIKTTGFNKELSHAENLLNGTSMLANIITGGAIQTLSDEYLKKNRSTKNVIGTGLACSLLDFAETYAFNSNKDTVEGLFDPNSISSAEADIINREIRNEKLKHAAEHTAFGYIAPFVASNILNKVLPEKTKTNQIVNVSTSFGVLSSISKVVLQGVRNYKDVKEIKSINGTPYAITDGQPCEAWGTIAKIATKRSINDKVDSSIYGSLGSLLINTTKNAIEAKQRSERMATVQIIPAPTKKTVESTKTTKNV